MKLDTLAGNAALKRQLSAQAQGRGLSHAYLISGPNGSGKRTLATLLSAAMVCTGKGEAPCGVCPGCKKALGGIHPDIIHVDFLEGKREILIEQTRQMRADAFIRPNEAPRKVYIIHHADAMNTRAQNSILKLLEEGPAYAAFLLLAENPGSLLITIRSRCEGVSLSPVSLAEAEAALQRKFPQKSPEEISAAARRCGGLIGKAEEELEGAGDEETRNAALELLGLIAKRDELGLCAWCVGKEKLDRGGLIRLFEQETQLLSAALKLQCGSDPGAADEQVRQAAALPKGLLLRYVDILEALRGAADFNVGGGHLCGALCAGISGAE